MTPTRLLLLTLTCASLAALAWNLHEPPPFDSDRIAAAETRMWKSYYGGRPQDLGRELVGVLQEQFDLSFTDSLQVAQLLAEAASTFRTAGGNYEASCLPALKTAYARIRDLTDGDWNADAAAEAELEWWVKRRTPGQDAPEEVGRSIARLYSILYGGTNPDIQQAGLLRAQAADLRDRHGDWNEIETLLRESYSALAGGTGR